MMQASTQTIFDVEIAFKSFLASHNHSFEKSLRFDTTEFNRFPCPHASNRLNQDVRYKLFSDGVPSGYFKCWHCDIEADFCLKQQHEVTPEEWIKHKEQLAKRKRGDEAYIRKLHSNAAKEAQRRWSNAAPCIKHDYLENKHVQSYGLRVQADGTLLIPCFNEKLELVNIERIYLDKQVNQFQKRPLKGGHRIGAFYLIGEVADQQGTIYISEGYSTAATVYECIGCPTVVAFNCGNLPHVAQAIRKLYPKAKVIIAADRDLNGAGEKHAKKAGSLVGGSVFMPDFTLLNLSAAEIQQGKLSDFNDLYAELLRRDFSKEAALGEVQLQLKSENISMIADKPDKKESAIKKKPSNEKLENNLTSLKPTIKKDDYPELSENSKPLNTYGNLEYMLGRLGITVRWNNMSRTREVIIPGFPTFYDDEENSALREVTNLATINHMPISKIDDHLDSLAQKSRYHPIVECINAKPWDGVKRLDQFIETLKTTNDKLSFKLIRRWMLTAIACAFSEKGVASQGVLVLQGDQNIGKTAWVKSLDPINCGAVKEGALVDPSNKDSLIILARHWIVEIGELDGTFRKADIARLKSHITNQIDEVRAAYARKNSRYARRTAYIATVNEAQYLIDDTGNRRWWTVTVELIDLQHGLDMQQVWAEVYDSWMKGEQTWLTPEELNLLNESNLEHEQIDPLEEKVLGYFDWQPEWEKHNKVNMTASDVLTAIGYDKPNKAQATRMGNILKKHTGKKPHRRIHTLPRRNTFWGSH